MLGLDYKYLFNRYPWQTRTSQEVLIDSEMLHLNFWYVLLTSWLSPSLNVNPLGEWGFSVLFVVLLPAKWMCGRSQFGNGGKDLPAALATSAVEMFWRFECTLKVTAGPRTLEEIIKKCKIHNQETWHNIPYQNRFLKRPY